MDIIAIPFSSIIVDEYMRTRPVESPRVARIRETIALGEFPPPMLVCKAKGGKYLLLDGNHRYAAWAQALSGVIATVKVELVDCPDEKSQIIAAIEPNIRQGNNYTIQQIGAMYMRLTRERGFSKSEARKLLRLMEEHAERMEPRPNVRMEATSEPSVGRHPIPLSEPVSLRHPERTSEPVDVRHPVIESESKEEEEKRAAPSETPVDAERAVRRETPAWNERAEGTETPGHRERAEVKETPDQTERADLDETPVVAERPPDTRAIRFHVERLQLLIPSTWSGARAALDMLAEAIIEELKGEAK